MPTQLAKTLPLLLVFAIGLAISLGGYYYAKNIDTSHATDNFDRWASERITTIDRDIASELERLNAVAAYIATLDSLNRSMFETFAQKISGENSQYQAIEWIPAIPHDQRHAFEERARQEGYTDYHIKEKDATGKFILATQRSVYYPVYYTFPLQSNEAAIGFDLGSNPARLAAIEKARDSGQTVATEKITLVQLNGNETGVLLFTPIYAQNKPTTTVEQRRQNILGFALGALRLGMLLERFTKNTLSKPAGVDIYTFDESNTTDPFLHLHQSRSRATGNAAQLTLNHVKSGLHSTLVRTVGGRTWSLVARPVDPTFASAITSQRWFALFGGLVVTLVIMFTIYGNMRRTAVIEKQVVERTQQLKTATERATLEEMRLKAILNNSAEAIITIDEVGIIQSINAAALQLFGYFPDEMLGRNVAMLLPPEERASHDSYVKNSQLHANRVINRARELHGVRRNGERFPMELNVSGMTFEGQRFFIGIMRDISERKKAEIRKAEFISTVSHELRTPLTSIKGSLGVVLTGALGQLPEKMRNLINIAYSNCDRQIALVNDLLDMEKISAGKMEYHMTPVLLNDIVTQAVAANQGYADKFKVKFHLIENATSASGYGDSGRLMQVMSNLLANAAKFSYENGIIEIVLKQIDEQHLQVSVRDFGSGIPQDFRSRIFERFSQADASDTKQKGGTGLGLSISKAIIEHHHGKIDFESEEGKGTTFYFTLPIYKETAKSS